MLNHGQYIYLPTYNFPFVSKRSMFHCSNKWSKGNMIAEITLLTS